MDMPTTTTGHEMQHLGIFGGFHGDAKQRLHLPPMNLSRGDELEEEILQPNYALFSFLIILMPVIVIGNFMTVFIFFTTPKLFNQTALCLINLAIADLLTGAIFVPFSLPCALHGECLVRWSRNACLTVIIMSYSCIGVSGGTLVIVSIDRFLKISRPLRYHTIFSKRRAIACLTFLWIFSVSATISFVLSNPSIVVFDQDYYHCGLQSNNINARAYTYTISIGFFALPVLVMTACSVRIARIARHARCQIANQEAVTDTHNPQTNGVLERYRVRRTDMRVAARVFTVVLAFFVCYLPYNVELVYARWTSKMFPGVYSLAAMLMVEINSAINPIIYVVTYATFRRALSRQLTKLVGRPTRSNSNVWTVTVIPSRGHGQSRNDSGI
ncbi:trace amine-associated receptor 7f-like [Diadema setosum]|uniref:trace amine-associated receptor 7f-like n=1 Tax=Diadema setosum TaxID=31175 RepID=UPI003B3B7DC8